MVHHHEQAGQSYPQSASTSQSSNEETLVSTSVQRELKDEPERPVKKYTEASVQSVDDVEPPPNGGTLAWLQVLGSFFLFFNCWGTVNAFGVFQTYYENNPYWQSSPSNISWIGSVQAFMLLMLGAITGPIYDRGYFRSLVMGGTFFVVFGFMMTSLCRTYWQTLLAQGVLVGIGSGLLWVPSVAILPQYFTTRKALASGLAAAGSSIGGIIYPIVFRRLQQTIGFGWATRTIAFIALAGQLISLSVMRQRQMPKQKRALLDLAAFKEPPYAFYCVGMFLAFASFYTPVYYIQLYTIDTRLADMEFAFYLLPILNAASVPGRIIPNFCADYVGAMTILIPAALVSGFMALIWISIHSLGGVIAFSCLYGFFSGAFVSIAPIAIVVLTPDLRKIGTRMGQSFFVVSFGLLIGTPVSGAILSSKGGGNWLGVQLFSGTLLILTSIVFVIARACKVGWSSMAKL